jgi:hypothetical protein
MPSGSVPAGPYNGSGLGALPVGYGIEGYLKKRTFWPKGRARGRQLRIFRRSSFLMTVAVSLLFGLPAVATEPPAGLVMKLTGVATPPLAELTEIPADMSIRLEPSAQLTFLHYRRCKLVTVAGGSVTLSPLEYQLDGRVISEMDEPCPSVYGIEEPAEASPGPSGPVMRGIPPHWPVNPEIIFVGSLGRAVRAAAIYADDQPGQPLVRLTVAGHRASLPPGTALLPPTARYILRVVMADRSAPVEVAFVGDATITPDRLLILRIE